MEQNLSISQGSLTDCRTQATVLNDFFAMTSRLDPFPDGFALPPLLIKLYFRLSTTYCIDFTALAGILLASHCCDLSCNVGASYGRSGVACK